jgi:hypothetical protein
VPANQNLELTLNADLYDRCVDVCIEAGHDRGRSAILHAEAGRARQFLDQMGLSATVKVWRDAWQRFIPFLEFPPEVRKIICSTDEIVKIVLGCRRRSPGDRLVARSAGFLHRRPSPPERRHGQDAAPHWTNDLDRAEHRHILKAGGTPPHRGSHHQTGAVPVGLVGCQCATKT